jgi:electron transfer flavoprotein beta subunit
MKILVAVKRVIDPNARVGALADGSGVDAAGAGMSMNPFDENAVEEAVRLREEGVATEIVAVSIGASAARDVLRHALAMGVDRAVLVECAEEIQPLAVARLLRVVVEREGARLVLLGKQAIDDDAGQAGPMLAGLLDWPQGVFVSSLKISGDAARVVREVDGGTEELELDLPAVVTADLRLNTPRFARLSQRMQAKRKTIETLAAGDLGIDLAPRLRTLKVAAPPSRRPGVRVGSAQELAECLKDKVAEAGNQMVKSSPLPASPR